MACAPGVRDDVPLGVRRRPRRLLNLYEKGKHQQWNASDRIDWSQDLDPENPSGLPDETIPIFGSDVWNRMNAQERT